MEALEDEEATYIAVCRCCLEDGELTSLWATNICDGKREIYGKMLVECFAMPSWFKIEENTSEQICEGCVARLRDAYSFRQLVLSSDMQLRTGKDDKITIIKVEEEGTDDDDDDEDEDDYDMNTSDDEVKVKGEIKVKPESSSEENQLLKEYHSNYKPAQVYEEVMYLDEGTGQVLKPQTYSRRKRKKLAQEAGPNATAKQRKTRPGNRKFKDYTEETMQKCLELVRKGTLTKLEASILYNVPRKTIAGRLQRGGDPSPSQVKTNIKLQKLMEEIKLILMFTNATPYKTKAARYYCAYCPSGPFFEEPENLRAHTREKHKKERTDYVETMLKPSWYNEILKLDIDDLHCTVCPEKISNWMVLFTHLKEKHRLDFEEAYTRIVPYTLKSNDIPCAICDELFTNYHSLDGHMNSHYDSYICNECGDTFVTLHRLKKHIKTHESGKYACSACDKVFAIERYRNKHFDIVHKQEKKVKCLYCDEMFFGIRERHLHDLEEHKEKVTYITCKLCGKEFDWKPYYRKHMRFKHGGKKLKHECVECDMHFSKIVDLKRHAAVHGKKIYECPICSKKYSQQAYLKKHIALHDS